MKKSEIYLFKQLNQCAQTENFLGDIELNKNAFSLSTKLSAKETALIVGYIGLRRQYLAFVQEKKVSIQKVLVILLEYGL